MIATHHEYRGYVFMIEQVDGERAFSVDFPDLPEIITSGETLSGAFANACEALDLHLECLREADVPIPQPWHRIQIQNDVPHLNLAPTIQPQGEERQPKHHPVRWLQFGLKTALMVMLIAAAVSAWIGTQREVKSLRSQIDAFELQLADYELSLARKSETALDLDYARSRLQDVDRQLSSVDEKFRRVVANVDELRTQGARTVDEQTVVIGRSWTGGDRGLIHLHAMDDLRNLHIADTHLGDEAAIQLSALTGIEQLQLTNTGLTVAGWRRLSNLGSVHALTLGGPEVTDEWLEKVAVLPMLKNLILTNTKVTQSALRNLQSVRPRLQIHSR